MTDEVSKVSSWVKTAVAQIAAFDGKNKRLSQTEKVAIGELLQNNTLNDADREYLESFVNGKRKKVETPLKDQNTDRAVDVPTGPVSAANEEQLKNIHERYARVQLFFDADGHVTRSQVTGKNGEVTQVANYKKLENGEIYTKLRDMGPDNEVTEFDGIVHADGFETQNEVMKQGDQLMSEGHRQEDGSFVYTVYNTVFQGVPCTMITTYKDGQATEKFIDANGQIIGTVEGTNTPDKYGNPGPIAYPKEE